ncbi:hypothetical protein D5272_10150 [bacterium D16-76]|nr:hypothetical protein [bacterium D16-76]
MYIYLWCFFAFAFLGWCSEVVYAAAQEKRFVNRGFLNGPLCPIYGLGVVAIDFFMKPFGDNLAVLIVGSMLLGTGLEWLAGYLLEKVFHQKWWDYSDKPHNIGGYVCLSFAIVWGLAGAAVVRFLMPFAGRLAERIPRPAGWVLLAVLLSLFLADFAVTVVSIVGLNRKLKNLEYVSRKLRAGSDRLGQGLYAGAMSMQEVEKEWQKEAARLKEKYEKGLRANYLHKRLLKAFPDLHSLRHNEELEALRQNVNVFRRKSSQAIRRRAEQAAAVYEGQLPEGAERPFAFGLCYQKLFWIFMVGNVVGFALETVYALVVPPHQFQLRVSVVFGPFILVYGFGAVAITLFLYKMYNQRDILIFFASMFIGGGFEYLCSFLQQSLFGTVSWEYSDSVLNISGRTNLMYAFFWGVLGLIWLKDLYPALSRLIERIPEKTGRRLTVAVSIFMAIDILLSAGAVFRQSQRVNNIPATNGVQQFFDYYFPDSFLDMIYPSMEYVGRPDILTRR